MGILKSIKTSSAASALAVAALVGVAPVGANALTISFDVSSTGVGTDFTIADGGAGDLDGTVNGVILGGSTTIGGFTISSVNASASDMVGASELTQTSLDVSGGAIGETLIVSTFSTFSGAAAAPKASGLRFSLGGSELGGALSGFGTAGGTVTPTLSFDPVVDGGGFFGGDAFASAVLSDPFNISSDVTIGNVGANKTTSFTSTVAAAVPLPAGGLLLLTALGGVAALRRKRKPA